MNVHLCAFTDVYKRQVLQSLPSRQIISGMGEIIKHGLIKDAAYYEWLMAHHDAILALEPAVMEEMIARSCEIKREVVEHLSLIHI